MELALPRSGWSERPEGVRSLENWLICWILLPNLGFWLLWIVGGPSRSFSILITGFAGVLLHRAPFTVKFTGFLACMIYSVLMFISALFNLGVIALMHSLQFASELNLTASVEYVAAGLGVIATIVAAWHLLRRPTTLVYPRRYIFALAAVVLAASVDVAMAKGNRGSYKRTPEPGAPFTSAVNESGFARAATGERHLVMIMVEAMGQPSNPALRRRLFEIWARPEVRARYDITSGDSLFYGSTTNGEIRELCGRWGEYPEYQDGRHNECLPARLAAAGYHTQAWHSFNGSFFERTEWYPNIGFEQMRFSAELRAAGAEGCPGMFPGACDRDVPRQIGTALRQAREPQFVYWLTVNSHLPVMRHPRLHTDECGRFDAWLNDEFPMTCRLMQLYDETATALAREITASDFPEADILIVGDHIPPFFDRHHRNQFEPDRVPWILLRARPQAPVRIAAAH